jgi:histone-lysine N-methyltransferase SETD2
MYVLQVFLHSVCEKMLVIQFSDIKTSFGQNLSVKEHRYDEHNSFLYPLLMFKISRKALDFIFHEAKRVVECGSDPKKCGCIIRKSYGLPCVCVIAKKIRNMRLIRLDEINSHWKKLTIEFGEFEDDAEEEVDDYACTAEFEAIKVCF